MTIDVAIVRLESETDGLEDLVDVDLKSMIDMLLLLFVSLIWWYLPLAEAYRTRGIQQAQSAALDMDGAARLCRVASRCRYMESSGKMRTCLFQWPSPSVCGEWKWDAIVLMHVTFMRDALHTANHSLRRGTMIF